MKDIYKEIAGHKGYKKIYTRISCVEEDIWELEHCIDIYGYIRYSEGSNIL